MSRRAITRLACAFGILLVPIQVHAATEFPIAMGADSTLSMWSPAFDGWNYLVGIQGDAGGRFRIAAQLVSPIGNSIGDRISVCRLGDWASGWTGPLVAFDGVNYLLVWTDRNQDGELDEVEWRSLCS